MLINSITFSLFGINENSNLLPSIKNLTTEYQEKS